MGQGRAAWETADRRPGRWHPFRQVVFLLDAVLRRGYGILEFTQDPACIFRIERRPARRARTFTDGTVLRPGDPILVLHFWNDHLPQMPPSGPDLRWAVAFHRRLRHSLRLLARYLEENPAREARALYGRLFLALDAPAQARALERLGFEVDLVPPPAGLAGRLGAFLVRGYTHLLAWAYNPGSVRAAPVWRRPMLEVWMSRSTLARLYAGQEEAPPSLNSDTQRP